MNTNLSIAAQELLSKDMREVLDEEMQGIDGGSSKCHNNSSCMKNT